MHSDGDMAGLPALVYSRALRAQKLSGIEHALDAGYLDGHGSIQAERLFSMGDAYREAFEIAEGQASNAGEGGGGGGGPKAPQPRLVEAGEDLADMRKGLSRRQRRILDLVCGHDMRVREAATVMSAGFPASVRALCDGLRAAAASLALEQQKRDDRGEMPVGLRVQLVRRALRRMNH